MATELEVKVKVTKEAYELSQGVTKFVKAVKTALADGWDTTQDLPAVISSAMADLVPALQGVDQLGEELKANQLAFYSALVLGAKDLVQVFAPADDVVHPVQD